MYLNIPPFGRAWVGLCLGWALSLNHFMYFMSLDHDCREGTGRTHIFTSSATNAGLFVHSGNPGRFLILLIQRHHLNSTSRTMARAVTTLHTIGHSHTILLDENRMAYLRRRFLFLVNRLDGTGRTHLTAACTLRTAMAPLIRHLRQHQVQQVSRGTQHVVWTLRHTQLAGATLSSNSASPPSISFSFF